MPRDALDRLFAPRPSHPALYKGSYGRVLVVGGSEQYVGALAFNVLGALHAGADLVYAHAPRRAADAAVARAPDVIARPFDAPFPDAGAIDRIVSQAASCDALVIGGGMERSDACHGAIRRIVVETAPMPVVLDAEGVLAYSGGAVRALGGRTAVLTPHPGEYARLTGAANALAGSAPSWQEEVASQAKRDGVTYLVKADHDVASDGARTLVGDRKSPYMTKGGYGDILAGVLGALVARAGALARAGAAGAPVHAIHGSDSAGVTAVELAAAASHLVTTAGRIACDRLGDAALASDALDSLRHVVANLRGDARRVA